MFYALVASTYIQRIADKYESERAFLPFFFSTYSERWHARQTRKGGMVIKLDGLSRFLIAINYFRPIVSNGRFGFDGFASRASIE